jgi:alcohol dehydrogenase class IV
MQFEFATAARIVFGNGKIKEAGEIASKFGKNALVVIGKGGAQPGKLCEILNENGIAWSTFEVTGEPTIGQIEEGVRFARARNFDCVIGYGGGSVIDTGKAISAFITNPGDLIDYLEVIGSKKPVTKPAVPLIAIPTTAGTGSEVSRNAVLAVPEKKLKVSLRSPLIMAKVALIDPELTYSVPAAVTASTGMDALAQVIEPYVSWKASPMTDLFCREGIKLAARSLVAAYHDGSNQKAREEMALTSLLSGLALANAGLGAVHGFASPICGMFDAPHGVVCACLLAPVTEINIDALRKRDPQNPALLKYKDVAKLLTGSENAAIEESSTWLSHICQEMHIPKLSDYGLSKDNIPEVVEQAAIASSMQANPIKLSVDELSEILMRVI